MSGVRPISVVETPEFLAVTQALMSDAERAILVEYLAYNPSSGDLVAGTGGLRKLRWGLENDRSNLSQQDRNDFRHLTASLVRAFKRKIP